MKNTSLDLLEMVVAPLDGDHPSPDLLNRLSELVHAGGIRVLDFVLATKNGTGAVSWSDVDAEEFSLAGVSLFAPGLIAEADIKQVLEVVGGAGWSIILVEHTWSTPDHRFMSSGAAVMSVAHIPGHVGAAVLRADGTGRPE